MAAMAAKITISHDVAGCKGGGKADKPRQGRTQRHRRRDIKYIRKLRIYIRKLRIYIRKLRTYIRNLRI